MSRSARESRTYGAPMGVTEPGQTTRERPKPTPQAAPAGSIAAPKEPTRRERTAQAASDAGREIAASESKAPPLRSTVRMPGEDFPALPQNNNVQGRRLAPASQSTGTRDLSVSTAADRIRGRRAQIEDETSY